MAEFNKDASDEEILEVTQAWLEQSQTYHDEIKRNQDYALEYYVGNQTGKDEIPEVDSDVVYNRVFEATETLVPIVTSTAHQFLAVPAGADDASKEAAHKVQQALNRKYRDMDMRGHLEIVVRNMLIMRFGVMKWDWDTDTNDVMVRSIDPRLIYIPKLRIAPNETPYVIELQEYDQYDFESFFPDEDYDEYSGASMAIGEKKSEKSVQVLEVTSPRYKVWQTKDKVLKRMENPYFDFEGYEEKVKENTPSGKIRTATYKRTRNHLKYPRINYVFFAPFRTGDAPFAHVSLIDIAIPIQDNINEQKRAITDNLMKMGNGQWIVDSDAMTQEESNNLTNEAGLIVRGKNLASENRVRRESGVPIPNGHFANLQSSELQFDNLFGTHGSVRGASNNETLGGQILDRQQALSRIDQMTNVVNRGVAELVDGLVQMFKMFYDEPHIIHAIGPDGAPEFIEFTQDDVGNISIETRSGNPISLDPQSKFNQAIQLWQLQAIDPETLYERLEFPDPEMAAKKLAAWRAGQLALESQMKQVAKPQERDVETPNDATERATRAATGETLGRAPLSNTPNQ